MSSTQTKRVRFVQSERLCGNTDFREQSCVLGALAIIHCAAVCLGAASRKPVPARDVAQRRDPAALLRGCAS